KTSVPGPDSGGVMTVLAADDEPVVRQVLVNHLGSAGYRTLCASSGAEALSLIETEPVDLVLLDVMMPRLSGYEVCRRIRQRFGPEELPVIFLSAQSRVADRVAAFYEGGNDSLTKPISKTELLSRVEAHLTLLASHRRRASELKALQGLLSICEKCHRIRDDQGEWIQMEVYIDQRSEARFSHGYCPQCAENLAREFDLDLELSE
ncbi:MAG: response regulator, partial [Acidobacteriota bacterium]